MSKVNHRGNNKKYDSCHTPKSHMQNYDINWNDGTWIGGLDKHDEKKRQRKSTRRKSKQNLNIIHESECVEMENRPEINKAILLILGNLVTKFPDFRFQQILSNFDVIKDGEDLFYEESSETLNRVLTTYHKIFKS